MRLIVVLFIFLMACDGNSITSPNHKPMNPSWGSFVADSTEQDGLNNGTQNNETFIFEMWVSP